MLMLVTIPSIRRICFPEKGITLVDIVWIVVIWVLIWLAMLTKPEVTLSSMRMTNWSEICRNSAAVVVPSRLVEPLAVSKRELNESKLLLTCSSNTMFSAVICSTNAPEVVDICLEIIVTSIVTCTLYVTMVDIMNLSWVM